MGFPIEKKIPRFVWLLFFACVCVECLGESPCFLSDEFFFVAPVAEEEGPGNPLKKRHQKKTTTRPPPPKKNGSPDHHRYRRVSGEIKTPKKKLGTKKKTEVPARAERA